MLVAWIGSADLNAPKLTDETNVGPIAQAVRERAFDRTLLLANQDPKAIETYVQWLRSRTDLPIEVEQVRLTSPTDFEEIYKRAIDAIEKRRTTRSELPKLTFHLSPGTPAMAAVWIILGKTRFPAELIESSREHGVRTVSVPFDISADFIPDLLREQDEKLRQQSAAAPPAAPEFSDIVHRSRVMVRLIQRARRVAIRNVPVLIEGESGTGKEMLARAIHRASFRQEKPFTAVNCGAIPHELVESELFGHEKGAFTGAMQARKGYFEVADGGTLFLDELGELPGRAQVKLLRVLQEGEVVHLGATKPLKVDVRIIAATNRTLTDEIAAGRFREDLFYRIAVAVLKIPPLRERTGDLGLLIDQSLQQVNHESSPDPSHKQKKLSAGAKNLLLSYSWPGNVRELLNTLRRAAIWSEGTTITADDAQEALLPTGPGVPKALLGRPLGDGFNLQDLLNELARHYLARAMDEAHGNKSRATELLGLPSYQTLTNWLSRYGVHT
ncbi:MAG: sigma-54 dependent transcriptional regulator [Xanthobacteraceae bacterium]